MTLRYGLSRVDLATFDEDALREMCEQRSLPATGDKEQLLDTLVEDSHPIYPLPRFNDLTPQGVVFGRLISVNGGPKGKVSFDDLCNDLRRLGVRDPGTAAQLANQQISNLVRFYGYSVERHDDGMVQVHKRQT